MARQDGAVVRILCEYDDDFRETTMDGTRRQGHARNNLHTGFFQPAAGSISSQNGNERYHMQRRLGYVMLDARLRTRLYLSLA